MNPSVVSPWSQLMLRERLPRPWEDGSRVPWEDPDFSRRMLDVHLDPNTPMASRPPAVIETHVQWLLAQIEGLARPRHRPVHVLDLGCGPGLYALGLARAGIRVTGIDISPASVDYARAQSRREGLESRIRIERADLDRLDPAMLASLAPVDVVTCWFGEFNGRPTELAEELLRAVASVMTDDGRLIQEIIPVDALRTGSSTQWSSPERSVFSDRPHLQLEEHRWDDEARAKITVIWVIDPEHGTVRRFTQCHHGYADGERKDRLWAAGFEELELSAPIAGSALEFPVSVAQIRRP